MSLMPQYAPIVVLLFLGTVLAVMLAAAAAVYGTVRNQPAVRRWTAMGLGVILLGYATLLFGASLTSQERVLAPGAKKYFCEIDCHLAYSVEGVSKRKSLGAPPHETRAEGTFYLVSVKTWFDESTFGPSPAAQRAIETMGWESTPLSRPLIPGGSYVTPLHRKIWFRL